MKSERERREWERKEKTDGDGDRVNTGGGGFGWWRGFRSPDLCISDSQDDGQPHAPSTARVQEPKKS